MRHLIGFSLKRRFFNKASIVLNFLLLLLIGGLFFADKILIALIPDFQSPPILYVDENLWETRSYFGDSAEFNMFLHTGQKPGKNKHLISYDGETWNVVSEYPLDMMTLQKMQPVLTSYQRNNLPLESSEEDLHALMASLTPIVTNTTTSNLNYVNAEKQNLAFVVITSIYFMMLSYSSVIANEVVYEKTSKILEMVLTSVSAKVHFVSKMLIGWLTIGIQTGFTAILVVLWYQIRRFYDLGYGLLRLLKKVGIINTQASTFKEFLAGLNLDWTIAGSFLAGLAFLFLGILLLQMVMVIVSSKVTSIEESSNIQAPCYLILLCVYYFTLSLNNPYQMSQGIGFYLSFAPFFSMLFMPCRLLLYGVSLYEILLSLLFAIVAIIVILDFGSALYQQGILDNKKIHRSVSLKEKRLEDPLL